MDGDWLEELHRAEIGPVVGAQQALEWMGPLLRLVSVLGADGSVLVLLSAVYWCLSPRLGARVGIAVLASAGVNAVAKLAFQTPRPPWIDMRVRALSGENSFGLPSGHAQTAVVVAGVMRGTLLRRCVPATGGAWVGWAMAAFVALVAVSRVYLGMHFISDVVAGLLIGAGLLVLYLKVADPLARWWRGRPFLIQVLLSALLPALLTVGGLFAALAHEGWSPPAAWRTAAIEGPGGLDRVAAMAGALFGTLAGLSTIDRRGWWFSARGGPAVRLARWALGIAGAGAVWLVTVPLGDSVPGDALRYALIGLWVALGAPLVFLRLGLAVPSGAPPVDRPVIRRSAQ